MNKLIGSILCAVVIGFCSTACAQPTSRFDVNAIPYEYAATKTITGSTSYSAMVKRLASNLIGVDIESKTTFGQNRTDKVIKGFADIKHRMQYKLEIESREVEFRIKLNL